MSDKNLTDKKIKEIHDAAIGASDSDDVWNKLAPLIKAQASNEIAADALIDVIRKGHLSINQSLDLLSEIFEAHKNNDDVVIRLGSVMDAARDLNYLNDPPPTHPLFAEIIKRLYDMASATKDEKKEALIVEELSSTARLMARQYDDIADESYARLVELLPNASWAHYNQGLFFKTRGRFSEGV